MPSARASTSPSTLNIFLRASSLLVIEYPVCGGSMNTRSKGSNHAASLSCTAYAPRRRPPLPPEPPQTQQEPRGAGPAVEDKANGPFGGLGAVEEVGGREDGRVGLAALLVQADRRRAAHG